MKKNIKGNTVVFVKENIRGNTVVFYWSSGKKNIREIIEIHTYILMSCISSLLMIDYSVLPSPQWCSGVYSA